jgi:NO-binding membrane sensor protein with MHYT domain
MVMATRYNPTFVVLSVLVAILASYVALEFASVVTKATGRARAWWLAGGAVAMGFCIWSMHFVGMLALEMPGMTMQYDLLLVLLSVAIAIGASWLALFIVSRPVVSLRSGVAGGCAMAIAIAGMHYTGMFSMRMAARIEWSYVLVALSVVIALIASFSALYVATRIRDREGQGLFQAAAAVLMGFAIAGMHYTGMLAATFVHEHEPLAGGATVLPTSALAVAVIAGTLAILGVALAGSAVERALSLRTRRTEEIAQLFRQAEKAMADLHLERDLRDRFMSALAHDLRTPLTAAMMSVQLAEKCATDAAQVRRQASRAAGTLLRMDGMIQDLLDAHRISAGQSIALKPEPCTIADLLRASVEELSTIHGQRFRLECAANLRAEWDAAGVRRAIENLCANAVKYGSPQGAVTVAVKPDGDAIELSVHNVGNPIEEPDLRGLFSLFHRGHANRDRSGWGLGLTIVKGVAEAHGGTVRVRSTPREGTTFTLILPARVAGAPDAHLA